MHPVTLRAKKASNLTDFGIFGGPIPTLEEVRRRQTERLTSVDCASFSTTPTAFV